MKTRSISHHSDITTLIIRDVYFYQFSSVAQSCLTHCDPMNRSTPGLPVHHQLPEFTQTHIHQVGDAIQPSHSLSSPSPPAHIFFIYSSISEQLCCFHVLVIVTSAAIYEHMLYMNIGSAYIS